MAQSTPARRWAATMAASPERIGITLVRLAVGIVFVFHGYKKWFVYTPSGTVSTFAHRWQIPPYATYAAMTAELLCGSLLILGLFTRLAAIPIVAVMAVAIAKVHLANGFELPDGYEFAMTLGLAALGLVLAGPGAFAADNILAKRR